MEHNVEKTKKKIIWDCGSPLYDSYELASLTHIIERNFMSLPFLNGVSGKAFCSRTPSDLGVKANDHVASTVVDLCCSDYSTAGRLFCGLNVSSTSFGSSKI
ncbi:unnamed protein product [Cochlearia groenlandica]